MPEHGPASTSMRAVCAGHVNWYTMAPGIRDYASLTTFWHRVDRNTSRIPGIAATH